MVEILEHMSALSDPTRCRMLLLLEQHELTVSELCAVLQMPQSSVSRQLKTLADDNWITSRRDATSRYYTMPLDDLDSAASRLWPLIREQVSTTTAAAHDERRLREDLFSDSFYLWAVLGLIDPTLTVGDLGCGTGQLTETVAPYVRRVIAVDGSAEMLDAARQRLADFRNVEIRSGELEALPIKDRQLDAALLSLVLHYSAEPVRTLTEVARVCRPGAKLLVVDMLPHHHEEYQQQMGHVWLGFSEKQIVKFLTAAGFDDARVRALPVDPDAKGPALFAAIATRTGSRIPD